ncbi:hypothetical protein EBU71_14535 [bacterium]|nr:hypothetical protein [Candidatus Elulimicrobium humile]
MPYNINRYSGSLLTTVEDGTVDNTLDIKLIGRNYAGYGEVQNENMVHLLENFANTSEPPRKITGQLWYDSGTRKLKFYDGTKFRTTGGAEVGTTAPSNLTVGDFWFNSQSNQLYAYAGDTKGFILVGPQSVEDQGTTELKSVQIVDTGGAEHAIVKAIIDDVTVFIISNDEFLLPDTGNNAIPGFKLIKKGMTLVDTSTVSSGDPNFGVTTSQYRFWGTTSNALKLEGKTSDDFVLKSSPEFQGVVGFDNDGYTVGTQDTLRVNIGSDGNPVFKSVKLDGIIKFLTKSSADNGASDKKPMSLRGNDILPGEHLISGIGTSDLKFKSVYALDFYGAFRGVADNAENLNVGGTYIEGSYGATANSVAARDNNGAITATQFLGLSQRASNIAGGLEGSLPYQSAPGVTTFLPKGNNNEVLSVNGTGQLDWVPITSLVNAGNADAAAPIMLFDAAE